MLPTSGHRGRTTTRTVTVSKGGGKERWMPHFCTKCVMPRGRAVDLRLSELCMSRPPTRAYGLDALFWNAGIEQGRARLTSTRLATNSLHGPVTAHGAYV